MANTMTPERRMALHDACASVIRTGGTVKLSAASAEALSNYLIELETLLLEVQEYGPDDGIASALQNRIAALPIPSWKKTDINGTSSTDVPTTCPICGTALNVDEEYMYKHYAEAYPNLVPWTAWTFYCESEDEHIGTWEQLQQEKAESQT